MDRREFVLSTASSLIAAKVGGLPRLDTKRHRFGVNYTPSENWWFCWNDWTRDSIRRDLDAISALGADHLRILLLWPFFQPNAGWISPVHIDRLGELMRMMAERRLDAIVTVFTGQLSGLFFLPPFLANRQQPSEFYENDLVWKAQELFVRTLSTELARHNNIIGFDFGNELNTCWSAEPEAGDAWMKRMFALMNSSLPNGLHVNGVDQQPWFRSTTFSPQALASQKLPTIHCYPWFSGALKHGGPMDPPSIKLIAAMATLVRSYAGDAHKPIWCEEFNTCIETLDDDSQAAWLEKSVTAAIEAGVGWFTYWDSHDVNRKFTFKSLEYSLGLLTNTGQIKKQGHVFSELVKAYAGKPVTTPRATSLPSPPAHNQAATWEWMLDWMGWKPRQVS